MKKKLFMKVAPQAQKDILSLQIFLELRDEKNVFPLFLERIKKAMMLLQEFPELGEYREDFAARVLIIPKTRYLIVFRVQNETLEILRFYHSSQKWIA